MGRLPFSPWRCQAALVLGLVACGREAPLPPEPVRSPSQMRLADVVVERWDPHGRLSYQAEAAEATVDRRSGAVEAQRVRVSRLDRPGARPLIVSAPRAAGSLEGDRVELTGGVVVVDGAGRTMKTERATYEEASDRLTAPESVVIEGDNYALSARSMVAHPSEDRVTFQGPVRAVVEPEGRTPSTRPDRRAGRRAPR